MDERKDITVATREPHHKEETMGKLQRARKSVASSSQDGHGRGRLSPSLAVSIVALFISLGGVGYAAATIGSAQIKNNSVQGKDIRNNDIRGKDIRTGTLGSSDVKDNALTGADVLSSSLGKVPRANQADEARTAGHANIANQAGNANTVGGRPPGAFATRWAIVDEDGDIRDQSGGFSVTQGVLAGQYYVNTGSTLANQPISVTPLYSVGNEGDLRAAKTAPCGGPGLLPGGVSCVTSDNANTAYVETLGDNNAREDTGFYIALPPVG